VNWLEDKRLRNGRQCNIVAAFRPGGHFTAQSQEFAHASSEVFMPVPDKRELSL
jgi:hypothetical protein